MYEKPRKESEVYWDASGGPKKGGIVKDVETDEQICYGCGCPGHARKDCPTHSDQPTPEWLHGFIVKNRGQRTGRSGDGASAAGARPAKTSWEHEDGMVCHILDTMQPKQYKEMMPKALFAMYLCQKGIDSEKLFDSSETGAKMAQWYLAYQNRRKELIAMRARSVSSSDDGAPAAKRGRRVSPGGAGAPAACGADGSVAADAGPRGTPDAEAGGLFGEEESTAEERAAARLQTLKSRPKMSLPSNAKSGVRTVVQMAWDLDKTVEGKAGIPAFTKAHDGVAFLDPAKQLDYLSTRLDAKQLKKVKAKMEELSADGKELPAKFARIVKETLSRTRRGLARSAADYAAPDKAHTDGLSTGYMILAVAMQA
eukprot:gene16891-7755_t